MSSLSFKRILMMALPIGLAIFVLRWPQLEERLHRWLGEIDFDGCYGVVPSGFSSITNLLTTQSKCRNLTVHQLEEIVNSREVSMVTVFWTDHYVHSHDVSYKNNGVYKSIWKLKHQCKWLHHVIDKLSASEYKYGVKSWIKLNAAQEGLELEQWLQRYNVSATTSAIGNVTLHDHPQNTVTITRGDYYNDQYQANRTGRDDLVDRGYIFPSILVFKNGRPVRRYTDKATPYKYACDKSAITKFLNATFKYKILSEDVQMY